MNEETVENQEIDRSKGQWFVIHCLSGHENKVRESILYALKISDSVPVYEVYIPTEKVSEVKNGKKVTTTRKFFPGYILVRMDLYDEMQNINEKVWYFIRNIQGVMGFLGSADKPVPLSEQEANDLLRQSRGDAEVKPKIAFEIGETVRINDGAFENFEGVVQEIDNERGRLKLLVSIFGRSTPTEVEFWQVDRSI